MLGLNLLCEAIRQFSLVRPSVVTSLDVRDSIPVLERTAANQIDIGFVNSMGTDYPGVAASPQRSLAAANVTCRRPVETTLAYSACNMVAGGLGLAVVDAITASQFASSAVICRPLVPAVPFEFTMVLPAHQPRSKMVNIFINIVKDLFDAGFPT